MTTIGIDIRVLGTGRTSGIEEYTDQLLEHLIPLDPTVHYKLWYAGRRPLVWRTYMDAPNVRVYDQPRSNRALLVTTRLWGWPHLDALVGGADVFFLPHFLLGATSAQCRRVMAWHDLSYERFGEFFSVGRRLWHQVQMRPRAQAWGADRIIAVSESTRQDLLSLYGIPAERVVTVYSGAPVGVPVVQEQIDDLRTRYVLPERFILALGTREPRKNHLALVRAFEVLARADRELGLICAGPEGWLSGDVEHAISISPFRERIRWVGAVPTQERLVWYQAAAVVAYPSFLEGYGLPPVEAMARGTPVVASANSSIPQVCNGGVLLVNPYSVGEIVGALQAALYDDGVRERLRRAGLVRAEQLTWYQTAQQTLGVLKDALSTVQ